MSQMSQMIRWSDDPEDPDDGVDLDDLDDGLADDKVVRDELHHSPYDLLLNPRASSSIACLRPLELNVLRIVLKVLKFGSKEVKLTVTMGKKTSETTDYMSHYTC